MKSTSDYRQTRFEVSSIVQFGQGHGGLTITCVERGTTQSTSLDLTTEELGPQLNEQTIALFAAIEARFAAAYDAAATAATPERTHALVRTAEQAKRDAADAEDTIRAADETIAKKLAQLAELDAAIAARAPTEAPPEKSAG